MTTRTTPPPAGRTPAGPPEQLPLEPSWAPTTPRTTPAEATAPRLRALIRRYSGPRDLDGQLRLAARLSTARTAVPEAFRNDGDLLALMHHAMALDIELAVAWDNLVFNSEGVGGMRGRLMAALVTRAGHEIIPVHVDDKMVRMLLRRCDGRPSGGAQWTLAEAQRGGLIAKLRSPWVAYGEDMLWWRCLSRLVRRWAPEVVLGFYEAGEIHDVAAADEGLEPADMSTAMTDLDGNPVPAPDVVDLLKDLDTADLSTVRNRYRVAAEEGMLGAFAGVVDGLHVTLRELLFDLGTAAQAREDEAKARQDAAAAAAAAAAGEVHDLSTDPDPDPEPAPAPEPLPVTAAPAGAGGPLPCGCLPAAVFADGAHGEGCTGAH